MSGSDKAAGHVLAGQRVGTRLQDRSHGLSHHATHHDRPDCRAPAPVRRGATGRGHDGPAARVQLLPRVGRLLRAQGRARAADPARRRRGEVVRGRRPGAGAGPLVPLYGWFARRLAGSRLVRAWCCSSSRASSCSASARLRPALSRVRVLRVGRHLQPVVRRAVLVVRQRHLRKDRRAAVSRHRDRRDGRRAARLAVARRLFDAGSTRRACCRSPPRCSRCTWSSTGCARRTAARARAPAAPMQADGAPSHSNGFAARAQNQYLMADRAAARAPQPGEHDRRVHPRAASPPRRARVRGRAAGQRSRSRGVREFIGSSTRRCSPG